MYQILIVLFLFALLYIVFWPFYQAYQHINHAQRYYNSTLTDRMEYIEAVMRRRHYVPMEALPSVRFDTNLGTLAGESIKCMSMPTYVSEIDLPLFDCSAVCENSAAVYFFVGEGDTFVINGHRLPVGGYCTTNSVPRDCNRETSVVLMSLNQWTCIAEDPRYFAGTGNMTQLAGRQHFDRILPGQSDRNVLFDRLMGREVNIARNTFRRSWDELLEDGSRRFEMRCNARDINSNLMFLNPLNPLECLPNVCTNVSHVHSSVRPNFETGECECGDEAVTRVRHVVPGDRTSVCASIVDGLDTSTASHRFRVECLNTYTPVDRFSGNKLLCPSDTFDSNTDAAFAFEVPGSYPLSGNGLDEPTHRLFLDARSRVQFNDVRGLLG
ncbi:pif-2 [Antheraea pernyi nucleopolyhedrovirus]|uniref:Per os infection factor-2 n=2 Tax=Antheraea pernyi nuclear polyhedrosis virus TaxID=161494 RepID=Q1HGX3_NPVAP|nr:pif-2 [Antheraea pernyi nucleopolyhedrovirus]AWD33649.1 per os infection factor-2 [Antheraea proylei nucleopolyhedrovirus]BBD50588.1 per os infection factor-2 [Antheraea yamamai nucleopolyhedrovirus]BBD50740.1 per os infection factor-2 [Samia cynthia nucleopolyhedrovirus]ABF50357.1 pif-2 [Antheraea pernyi nucleopolyhedrovirus]ABQ12357.1 per os infection factor-2 [Antheraea pernyi nucleopolyhedrovirus]